MTTSANNRIRILLIDDHLVVRSGLRMLIESRPGMTVVGDVATQTEAIATASREKPDIVLLDLDLGVGSNGIDFIPELHAVAKDARILLLTAVRDPQAYQRAVLLGAMGLVRKEKAAAELFKAIEKVYAGEMWLDRSLIACLLSQVAELERDKLYKLTEREREVVKLVSEGLKNRAIGERLSISETTVSHHLTSIFSKLGVSNRFELILLLHQVTLDRQLENSAVKLEK
jgi:DNA-binding NarL/FixJ family response regulator